MSTDLTKLTKAHSDHIRDLYVAVGWTVTSAFRDAQGEGIEYILAWLKEGLPIQPKLPGLKEDGPT